MPTRAMLALRRRARWQAFRQSGAERALTMALAHAEQLGVFGAVRGGAIVLLALALVGAMAPFLGTFDPSAMDASFISVAAGTAGNVTLPDGSPLQHTFWMGSDSVGRDIWSRVLYGTRISLLVGLLTAALAVVIGCALGMLAGYGHDVLEDDARILRTAAYPWHEQYGGECPGVYYVRLQRDGWTMKYTAPDGAGGHTVRAAHQHPLATAEVGSRHPASSGGQGLLLRRARALQRAHGRGRRLPGLGMGRGRWRAHRLGRRRSPVRRARGGRRTEHEQVVVRLQPDELREDCFAQRCCPSPC